MPVNSSAASLPKQDQVGGPAAAYLQAAEQCREQGVTSASCARAAALQSAALAAGLDPAVVTAAQQCLEGGDVEACAKAGTAAGLTAACVAATSGAGTLLCGPLASVIVNLAWPVVWGVLSQTFEVATSLVSVGLEAVGLKDTPQFRDLAEPMHQAALAQFQSSIQQSSDAIADAIGKTREAIGMRNDNTILLRHLVKDPNRDSRWSEDGVYVWTNTAAERLIWDYMANTSDFAAGFSSGSGYGSVGLMQGSMGSDRQANIESAYTLVSLVPWWSINWDTAWERDNAFKFGSDALGRFYAHRFDALSKAIQYAMHTMITMESLNPKTRDAMASGRPAFGPAPSSGAGTGTVIVVLAALAALGAGGWYVLRSKERSPKRRLRHPAPSL